MLLTSWDVIREFACKGVNRNVLRYSREKGYIKSQCVMTSEGPQGKRSFRHLYERSDVEKWVSDYVRRKDGMRGKWRINKSRQNETT